MTQQLREQEQLRKANKYDRWQKKEINRATAALDQNMKQILCRRMPHCRNEQTQYCFYCTCNKTHLLGVQTQNYFKPNIPGIKFL